MQKRLYIAAKAPRPGIAKTRLGRAIGDAAAVALYRAFLQDIGMRFAQAPFAVGWYVTPPGAWAELAPIVGWTEREAQVLAQGEGNWTERQRHLFRGAPARREEHVILIASDSPQVTVDVVAEAFRVLERDEIVVGPVFDGGYYLLGMHGWHDVLAGIRMSTTDVVQEITARAHSLGLSVGQVETTFDIDEVEDLQHLQDAALARTDLAATCAALDSLGLPRKPA